MKQPYLLFDAGGTLIFVDGHLVSQVAADEGFEVDERNVYEAHYKLVHQFDMRLREKGQFEPVELNTYLNKMVAEIGITGESGRRVVERIEDRHKEKNLWSSTAPWMEMALDDLSDMGYSMSVISNADGRVESQLESVGLSRFFDLIVDSDIVGIAKPDPEIFFYTLSCLNAKPAEVVYIGDIFYLDVLTANRAGVGAIHIDLLGLYSRWPGEHIQDVRDMPQWLKAWTKNPKDKELYPLGGE